MSMYSNKNAKKTGKVAVLTRDGSKLIGNIVELDDSAQSKAMFAYVSICDQEGIWLRRENHMTFLGDHNISVIRPARPGEKEIN